MAKNSRSNRVAKAAVLAAFGMAALYAILLVSGFFSSATQLSLDVAIVSAACNGTAAISAELMDSGGNRVPDAPVTFYAGNSKIDTLKTDNNGRIRTTVPLDAAWCGMGINFSVDFEGDYHHKWSANSTIAKIKIPTALTLEVDGEAYEDESLTAYARLTNAMNGAPVKNKNITLGSLSAATDENGTAEFALRFGRSGSEEITVSFEGDSDFEASGVFEKRVDILERECAGGTPVGKCSGQHICREDMALEFSCEECGCTNGLVCSENRCISEEQRIEELVETLQKSSVLIRSVDVTGSGVIIDAGDDETTILTNRHVVDPDFISVVSSNLEVLNSETELGHPAKVMIAPNDIDLAVIIVNKSLGPAADIDANITPDKGASVLVLGAPLGIQNSVSSGIVSNFFSTHTESGFEYDAIQTDAAVNPGNSGGGVFLASSGRLIGITSFKLIIEGRQELAEGLGFAVPVSLAMEFPVEDWESIRTG